MALKPEFFAGEIVVKKVVLAVHVPYGGGRAVHENRPSHGIAFCTSGGYRYTFSDGNVLDCRQGDCIYLPKDSSYRVALLADAERPSGLKEAEKSVYAINFLTWEDSRCAPCLITPKNTGRTEALFASADRSWEKKGESYPETVFADLYQLLALLKDSFHMRYSDSSYMEKLKPALRLVRERATQGRLTWRKWPLSAGSAPPG